MTQQQGYVGIDSAAKTFTAVWSTGGTSRDKPSTFAQTPAGFQQLQQQLRNMGSLPPQTLVVLEATGS